MTTAEYLSLPETVRPQQLAFGAHRVADSPLPRHQEAVLPLAVALNSHLELHQQGTVWIAPLDVILDYDQALVVQPDLFVVSNERAHIVGQRVSGPPDLVIEVISPRPRVGDIDERVGWFARYGVRECWLAYLAERTIDVLTFEDGRTAMRERFVGHRAIRSGVLTQFQESPVEIFGYSTRV